MFNFVKNYRQKLYFSYKIKMSWDSQGNGGGGAFENAPGYEQNGGPLGMGILL